MSDDHRRPPTPAGELAARRRLKRGDAAKQDQHQTNSKSFRP